MSETFAKHVGLHTIFWVAEEGDAWAQFKLSVLYFIPLPIYF